MSTVLTLVIVLTIIIVLTKVVVFTIITALNIFVLLFSFLENMILFSNNVLIKVIKISFYQFNISSLFLQLSPLVEGDLAKIDLGVHMDISLWPLKQC
jgi:hypothetical protein